MYVEVLRSEIMDDAFERALLKEIREISKSLNRIADVVEKKNQ